MAGSVNKVILVGNLGRDPEIRRMNNGDPVVNCRSRRPNSGVTRIPANAARRPNGTVS